MSSRQFMPKEWITQRWDEGYYITSVAGAQGPFLQSQMHLASSPRGLLASPDMPGGCLLFRNTSPTGKELR